ncbi:hypothetical protein PsYK624_063460 [Phanerochaete sordida]|uniref:Uncharacterized protein n=1 Tax=Phanerochaete sordida TaxID=48140 RepID=A0A9P3LD45_9APHY|nr:hypothetical protein PsYK624_063460 [Phanerochaete sordida]
MPGHPSLNDHISSDLHALCRAVAAVETTQFPDSGFAGPDGAYKTLHDLGVKIGQPCQVRGPSLVTGYRWFPGLVIAGPASNPVDGDDHRAVLVLVPEPTAWKGHRSSVAYVLRPFFLRWNEVAPVQVGQHDVPPVDVDRALMRLRYTIVLVPVRTRVIAKTELGQEAPRFRDCTVWFPAFRQGFVVIDGHRRMLVAFTHMRPEPRSDSRDHTLYAAPLAVNMVVPLENIVAEVHANGQLFAHHIHDTHVFAAPDHEPLQHEMLPPPSALEHMVSFMPYDELVARVRDPRYDSLRHGFLHSLVPYFSCGCITAGRYHCEGHIAPP